MTVYVSIGNSDDGLTQKKWSCFCDEVDQLLTGYASHRYGAWFSLPMTEYQNACWAVEIAAEHVDELQGHLCDLAGEFRQDSIAWAEATTMMLRAAAAGERRREANVEEEA